MHQNLHTQKKIYIYFYSEWELHNLSTTNIAARDRFSKDRLSIFIQRKRIYQMLKFNSTHFLLNKILWTEVINFVISKWQHIFEIPCETMNYTCTYIIKDLIFYSTLSKCCLYNFAIIILQYYISKVDFLINATNKWYGYVKHKTSFPVVNDQ